MITGQGIETVVQNILSQRDAKKDYVADTRKLTMNDRGEIQFDMSGSTRIYKPTPLCLRQIGERVGIPSKYVERMLASAPQLLASNVNHWFQNESEKRMVRTLENGSNIARAFLSERFRPLDNVDIAAKVLPKLEAAGCEIKSAAITDTRLYIQAIIPRLEAKVAKVGDVVNSGVVISNSEVGCGSLWIEHMIYTLRCTNGMVGENIVKQVHVGRKSSKADVDEAREYFSDNTRQQDDKAFWMKVGDMVTHALSPEMFHKAVAKLSDAAAVEIDKPAEVVEFIAEKFNMQDAEAEAVLNHFIKGGRATQYGLLNAVTRTAEDLTSYDRAIEFERIGGEIMLLKPTDFSVN